MCKVDELDESDFEDMGNDHDNLDFENDIADNKTDSEVDTDNLDFEDDIVDVKNDTELDDEFGK